MPDESFDGECSFATSGANMKVCYLLQTWRGTPHDRKIPSGQCTGEGVTASENYKVFLGVCLANM